MKFPSKIKFFLRLLSLFLVTCSSYAKPKAQTFVFPYNYQYQPYAFGGYYPFQSSPGSQFQKFNQQFPTNPFANQPLIFNPQQFQYPGGLPTRITGDGGVGGLQHIVVFVPMNPMHQFWSPAVSAALGIPLPGASTEIRGGSSSTCKSQFGDVGNCLKIDECISQGGRPDTYCRDFSKMCCIVSAATCGASSSSYSTYFKNENWPLNGALSSSCGIDINQATGTTCVRVTFKMLNLPANTGYCDGIALRVLSGTGEQKYEPLCGSLTGNTYEVPFDSSNKLNFAITTTQKFSIVWKINFHQVSSCEFRNSWPLKGSATVESSSPSAGQTSSKPVGPESGKPAKSPTVGEIFSPGTSGSPGAEVDIIPDIGAGSDPSAYSTCGLSGIRSQKRKPSTGSFRIRDHGQIPASIHGCIGPQGNNLCRNKDEANPLLHSLDWNIPVLSDANLYKYSGTATNLDTRITYGTTTQPHEYPWAIAMYSNGRFHCGATLISDRHVLTAAHCVIKQKDDPSSFNLSIGDWNINSQTDGKNIEGQIAKIVTHPGYSTVTLKHDVAVLTLRKSVTLSDTVRPICLPHSETPLDGQLATVTGWGRDENNKLQSVLMKLSANIVSNTVCDNRWIEKGAPPGIIVDTMLCMDAQYGDSCKGDSGGPAIMEQPADSGKFVQVGIVSFGSASCTDKNLPGVYTNVGKMVDWIKQQMV